MRANLPLPAAEADMIARVEEIVAALAGSLESDVHIDPAAWDAALLTPLRDVLSRPGKRLRARLLEYAWQLAGGAPGALPEQLLHTIELLHVGSLVIDDIEDDSRVRRGGPALHREYGLPLALNTGNWLYFAALATLHRLPLPSERKAALYEETGNALLRCHQGQALDLAVRITSVRRADVPVLVSAVTRLKTGSLMKLAALLGARAAGGAPAAIDAIGRFGAELGVGLQMLDDWSGISIDRRRDKGIEDIRLARPTWPWAWLAETGDDLAYAETVRQARELSIDWQADRVRERLRALLTSRAPAVIRAQLDTALGGLRSSLGDSGALAAVCKEVDALERAFREP
jgi:geranylgeranyl pyrophosphate synthase